MYSFHGLLTSELSNSGKVKLADPIMMSFNSRISESVGYIFYTGLLRSGAFPEWCHRPARGGTSRPSHASSWESRALVC